MSGWGWGSIWGGSGKNSKDGPKNAILGLRSTLEMLTKREKHLQNQMDEQDNIARKNVNANKGIAKAALRRKKNYEHQLEQTQAQMLTVEREISSIETANINKETLDAMKNAQQAMKKIHGGLTIDKVDQTMEDLREQHAIGEEIAEALTQGNVGNSVDEDELDDELNELQQEELDTKMLKTGTVPVSDQVQRMPSVGNQEIKGKAQQVEEDDEEEELRKLQAEMAIAFAFFNTSTCTTNQTASARKAFDDAFDDFHTMYLSERTGIGIGKLSYEDIPLLRTRYFGQLDPNQSAFVAASLKAIRTTKSFSETANLTLSCVRPGVDFRQAMACTSLLSSGIFTITDANLQSIGLCPGFFALRQKRTVPVRPRGARQHDSAEWDTAATSVILSLVSLANPQVRQITNETNSCGSPADFRTPPSSFSSAMQSCVQRIAAKEPDVAINFAYSYALYTSAIALGSELGMPRPPSLRGSGLDRARVRCSRKKRLGPGGPS
ncbi:Vacuolar-sorting protein [Hortaea werneckii]|nr:Vacuolar-sorting protein [Hortaea werneckii]KAI6989681.1 Vacuolar-sorting protein [Hortaea werneckii]KAI7143344.1 Vacuolar-sorting protein [Hortaea werneckii]KAI7170921.1 Vacuolar-sorting protein [Hortaea werneckii]KAI7186933.1 Vacuolar-sorting protein [Hortaea werneckii]